MKDLFVIEASGKIKSLARSLRSLGIDADVVATLGHLYENPRTLTPLGVELSAAGSFVETHRQTGKPAARAFLERAIGAAGRVIVATDIDQEGHAIGNDVAELVMKLRPGLPILRMQAVALDPTNVADGLRRMSAWTPEAGYAGIGRRIADRLIGAYCSDRGNGIFVGRVQAALLSLCLNGGVRRRVATMSIPAADGGRPFVLSLEAPSHVSEDVLRSLPDVLGSAAVVGVESSRLAKPLSGGEALLQMEADLGLSIADAADLLQDLYEAGELTYPRTGMQAYTGLGAESIRRLASVRGVIAFRRDAVPVLGMGEGPHESLRALDERLQLQKPLQLRGTVAEQVLALVGRRSVESGVPAQVQFGRVAQIPHWAGNVSLTREVAGARVPWSSWHADAVHVRERSPEGALLAAMMEHGIARPSTYAAHAVRMAGSGLIDAQMRPTQAGLKVLAAAPAGLKDYAKAPDVERMLDSADCVRDAVQSVLDVLDVGSIATRVPSSAAAQSRGEAVPDCAEGPEQGDLQEAVPENAPEIEEEADEPVYRFSI
ncbi:toprim domain-containing protein [Xanthomonas citri]|uniref:toprim domain-containing protein n=1 Tax=Xanthomonas citri TaxID=346 RepID=UPI000CCE612F|nr:toprim domain-containing protein [Xanthomonas citri]PNV26573.1 hypothetical protein xavtCFBP7764_22915 [Xanthomonas citri]